MIITGYVSYEQYTQIQ